MKFILAHFVAAAIFLSGCAGHDPPPQAAVPVPADVDRWDHVAIRNWGDVAFEKRDEALVLLGAKDCIPISPDLYGTLIRTSESGIRIEPVKSPPDHRLYLIKARGYASSGGKLRFNKRTRELSILLVTYNGEISFPGMRWTLGDIPIVVALPAAPSRIHKSAEIGGDSVRNLMDHD